MTPDAQGRFIVPDLAAGRYHAVVEPGVDGAEPRAWANVPFVVEDGAETTTELVLQKGPPLMGVVDAAGVGSVTVQLTPVGSEHPEAFSQSIQTAAHGPLLFPAVPPGRYRLEALIGAADYLFETRAERSEDRLLTRVLVDGIDVTDAVVTVDTSRTTGRVRVRITDTASRIQGLVRDADSKPTTSGAVMVFPANAGEWTPYSSRVRVVRADTAGRYDVTPLPAGRYLVAHVDALAPGQLRDRVFLTSLAASAQSVTLAESDQALVDLSAR
jgi:hypothetical protein